MAPKPQRADLGKTKDRAGAIGASGLVAPLLALTLIAIAAGGFLGTTTLSFSQSVASAPQQEEAKRSAGKKQREGPENCSLVAERREGAEAGPELKLKELAPVVTNLGDPETVWVRLEAAIVYEEKSIPNVEILASQIRSDIVAFLRATSLSSIQGADGLGRLHEDLSDRASIRSGNRVREFIIETFVVQ
jgi:flagellar FliL protein